MTNLRDWQKKASERMGELANEYAFIGKGNAQIVKLNGFRHGYSSRDAEIDLLLQIIEKQSEALAWYERSTVGALRFKALSTQAEVQGLVEKLVKDE
jgi:ribosomal protein S12 methylthiotransferase accessory factor YcaO